MASLDEFYTQPRRGVNTDDYSQRGRAVPQFESGPMFFGDKNKKNTNPRILNFDQKTDGPGSADHYAGIKHQIFLLRTYINTLEIPTGKPRLTDISDPDILDVNRGCSLTGV